MDEACIACGDRETMQEGDVAAIVHQLCITNAGPHYMERTIWITVNKLT